MSEFPLCFNPLWINTALKLLLSSFSLCSVSIPYGLTLLSNDHCNYDMTVLVSIPYGLTLLSNSLSRSQDGKQSFNPLWINTALKHCRSRFYIKRVSIPYGLTLLSNISFLIKNHIWFQSPMD